MAKFLTAVVASTLFLTSCGGGGSSSTPSPTPPPSNQAPVFSSSVSAQADEGGSLAYQAVASDPDSSDAIIYSLLASPDASLFQIDSTDGTVLFLTPPDFEAPSDADGDNVYVIQVGATDGGGATTALTVEVSVQDLNEFFVFTSPQEVTSPENELLAYLVTTVDPDANDLVSYRIFGGADAALFSMDSATGQLMFITEPDYESPQDTNGDNVYEVGIIASDLAGLSRTLLVSIRVSDVSILEPKITFPTSLANLGGFATTLTVSGHLMDSEDGEVTVSDLSGIESLRLFNNGAPALLLPDPAGDFSITIDAVAEQNTIAVELRAHGNQPKTASTVVFNTLLMNAPQDVVLDAARDRLLIPTSFDTVYEFDLIADKLSVFSALGTAALCQGISSPGLSGTLYADIDPVSDQVILASPSKNNSLVSIDLVTRVRCELDADTGRPSGTNFSGIAIDSGTGTAYISEEIFPSSVYSYDLSTGSMSVLTEDGVNAGTPLALLGAVGVDLPGDRVVAVDLSANRLVGVDLVSGDRTTLSDTNQAPRYTVRKSTANPEEFLVEFRGDLEIDTSSRTALFVNKADPFVLGTSLVTGERSIHSTGESAGGQSMVRPIGIDLAPDQTHYYVVDEGLDGIFRVGSQSGDATLVMETGVGSGPTVVEPRGLDIHEESGLVFYVDTYTKALRFMDPTTGERQIVSDANTGSGPLFSSPTDLAIDAGANRAFVVDGGPEVIEVNLASGERSIVSGAGRGIGPEWTGPARIALDLNNNRLYILDSPQSTAFPDPAVYAVDMSSGDRAIVSSSAVGAGPEFSSLGLRGIAFDSGNSRILVTDSFKRAVLTVDPVNGDRAILSQQGQVGTGIDNFFPSDLVVDESQGRALVGAFLDLDIGVIAIDLDTGDRELLANLGQSAGFPYDIAFRETGKRAFVSSNDGRILIVDLQSGAFAVSAD
jgi:hypothetical protein